MTAATSILRMLTPLTLALGEQLPEMVEKLRRRFLDSFERRHDQVDLLASVEVSDRIGPRLRSGSAASISAAATPLRIVCSNSRAPLCRAFYAFGVRRSTARTALQHDS